MSTIRGKDANKPHKGRLEKGQVVDSEDHAEIFLESFAKVPWAMRLDSAFPDVPPMDIL